MQQEETGPSIYSDEQVKDAMVELFGFESLTKGMKAFLPAELNEHIFQIKDQIRSVEDFQSQIAYPLFKVIQKGSISKLSAGGLDQLDPGRQYLFISNHRDIILDSAFLNVLLFEHGFKTSQIAIGDNLMRHRISELIFHINKSFVVKRSGTPMELYRYSILLSNYIQDQITGKKDSIWIAQREGRAKDGDDRTQVGLMKMLSLCARDQDLKQVFKSLSIVPVSISYEYDPCDLLKAQEYLNKIQQPDYKKTFEEDVQHMLLGLKGFKGAVNFHFSKPLDEDLDMFDTLGGPKKQLEYLAERIDQKIHQHYQLQSINYVALDLLNQSNSFQHYYDAEARRQAIAYFEQRFQLLTQDADGAGKNYLLKMYANPLINHLAAENA